MQSYVPVSFEGREDTSSTVVFSSAAFRKALNSATDETLGDVKAAIRSALNKVIRSAKVMISSEIRKKYNISKAVLDARMYVLAAKMKDLEAALEVGGRSVSLSYFNAKQTDKNMVITRKGTATRKRVAKFQGVEVEVVPGKRVRLKSAFMRTFKSGHIGILQRVGKGRYPIRVKSAISIASMMEKETINSAVIAKVDADLERVFWSELEYFMNRGSK